MPDKGSHDSHTEGRRVDRRTFVKAAGASGIAVGLAGCSGGGGGGDGGGGGGGDTDTPISTEPPEEEVTIQVAADGNFKGKQDQINQTLHENGGLPDNITVQWLAGSFTTGDRRSKYQQILSAGQQKPTVFMMDNGWTIPFIARGQLQNLSKSLPSSITDQVMNNYFEPMVATATMGGDLFGVPLFPDFPTVQYRKDLMAASGYSESDFSTWATESMKWQEFSEIVSQVAEEQGVTGFNWQGAAYAGLSCCDFVEFKSSWGGAYFGGFDNLFGPVGDRPVTVDEEPVVNAVRMMRTFIHGQDDDVALDGYQQISPEAVVQYKEESSRKPFTSGEVLAHRNWPYSININAAEDKFGEDLGVMPIPFAVSADESKYGPQIGGIPSALGGWHLTMNPNATTTRKQAAVSLFKALQSEQVRLDMFEIGGWIPPIPELVASSRAKELEPIGRYVETLKIAGENAVPRPVTVVWPQESTQIAKEVNAALRQQKTPTKALSDLKSSLESIEQSA